MAANFSNDLSFSHKIARLPFWEEVYKTAFPTMTGMQLIIEDGPAQRAGIDRMLILEGGEVVLIDEKVIRKSWSNFFLEYFSDAQAEAPGWIMKNLSCDFIAYVFLPSRECYLLPFLELQEVWLAHRDRWFFQYNATVVPNFSCSNKPYETHGVLVPIAELMPLLPRAMHITWSETND